MIFNYSVWLAFLKVFSVENCNGIKQQLLKGQQTTTTGWLVAETETCRMVREFTTTHPQWKWVPRTTRNTEKLLWSPQATANKYWVHLHSDAANLILPQEIKCWCYPCPLSPSHAGSLSADEYPSFFPLSLIFIPSFFRCGLLAVHVAF